jgi:hypothetical protein
MRRRGAARIRTTLPEAHRRVVSGHRNFYRIVFFNAALFGVGFYSALKSPFTSAFILEE